MRKRILLAMLTVASIGLMLASVAYACTTTIQGPTTVTPTSGKPGTVVTASATGAVANKRYMLHFLNFSSDTDKMNTCMSGSLTDPDQPIGGPTNSDGSGNIAATTGVIPPNAQPTPSTNVAWICFVSPGYGVATLPASFTVLGLP